MPGKILEPFFQGASILDLLIRRLINNREKLPVIVATTEAGRDDAVCRLAERHGVAFLRGPESDVLTRFLDVARKWSLGGVVRVCADNPFLDLRLLEEVVEAADADGKADYVSHRLGQTPAILTHYGFFCEWAAVSALDRIRAESEEPADREHVTRYLYRNAYAFDIQWLDAPKELENNTGIRLTVDTLEDFRMAAQLYERVMAEEREPTVVSVLKVIGKYPAYRSAMSEQIARHTK